MRIAYLTPQYPKVSHTFIRREILEIERRGHQVFRISVRRPEASVVDPADIEEQGRTVVILEQSRTELLLAVIRILVSAPVPTLVALVSSLWTGLRGSAGMARQLAYVVEAAFLHRYCASRRIDHVHVHFGTNAATVALLLRRIGGPTFSMTVHGPDEFDAPMEHRLAEKIAESAFTVAISSYTAAQLRRWAPFRHWTKIHVVRCGVGPRFFKQSEPLDPASRRILCVGRLTAQKGQLVLLDALADLRVRRPELTNVRLVLAGDGEMRAAVEERISALALSDCVEITGWVHEDRVLDELRRARCLVLPSFAEGLPVVLMEGLASGRAVLSTWVAGIPELVRPGECGWLVPPADAEPLSLALEEMLESPATRLEEMARVGAERVARMHAIENEVERLEALFMATRGAGG